MITKERIDELIQQKAKIWGIGKQGNVFCIGLKFRPHTLNNKKWLENKYEVYSKFFENLEEAEWYKEFGNIERTEKLELPTWEEDVRKDILFSALGGVRYIFMNKIKTGYSIEKENPYIIRIQKIGECDNFIDYEYTKENYTLACRKAKELFLGEKK